MIILETGRAFRNGMLTRNTGPMHLVHEGPFS